MIHGIVTALNDVLCPNVTAEDTIKNLTNGAATTLDVTLADGSTVTLNANTKILDADNCATGSDKQLPPQELFSRIGTERYTNCLLYTSFGICCLDLCDLGNFQCRGIAAE